MMHPIPLLLTVFTTSVVAAPTPPSSTSPNSPCPSEQLQSTLSTSFGYQLAGATTDLQSLGQTCDQIHSGDTSKWEELGLSSSDIANSACGSPSLKTIDALPQVAAANTQSFTTLLTNSFDKSNKKAYNYLCSNIRYVQVAGFLLDDSTIVNATCQIAGTKPQAKPFTALDGAKINTTAVAAFDDAQSRLYGSIIAAQADSPDQLRSLCQDASRGNAHFKSLHLDEATVRDTICAVEQPLDVEGGKSAIKQCTTDAFVVFMQNISNARGYQKWLCDNVSVHGMNTVGLNGDHVKQQFCGQ